MNSVPLFNTYICDIESITSLKQDPKTDLNIQAMNPIKAYYGKRGFKILEMRGDQKLEPA